MATEFDDLGNVQSQPAEQERLQELGYPPPQPRQSALGLPPGGGKDLIPHYTTFASILNYVTRTYRWTYDAARKHSDANALAIRNDTDIMEALRARQMPTAQLPWHVEPIHPEVQSELDAAQKVTDVIKLIPKFQQFRLHLLEAVWWGRYGLALTCKWDFDQSSDVAVSQQPQAPSPMTTGADTGVPANPPAASGNPSVPYSAQMPAAGNHDTPLKPTARERGDIMPARVRMAAPSGVVIPMSWPTPAAFDVESGRWQYAAEGGAKFAADARVGVEPDGTTNVNAPMPPDGSTAPMGDDNVQCESASVGNDVALGGLGGDAAGQTAPPSPFGTRRLLIDHYRPVNGDKLVFKFSGQPGVLVHQQYEGSWQITDRGRAHFLTPEERELLLIHEHEPEDADFFQGEQAGAIHGVGCRGRVYWLWWLKTQVLGWLMDYLERVGAGGFTVYFYEHGNPQSLQEVTDAAETQALNNFILFPRYKDSGTGGPGIQRIEPSNAGAQLLEHLVSDYFDVHIRRYIVGMNIASEKDGAMTIGEGANEQDLSTFGQRIKFDAENLDATLTAQLLPLLYKYNCPGVPPGRFVSEVEKPNAGKLLEAAQAFYEMGGSIDEDDLRNIVGLAEPEPGHNVLSRIPPLAPTGYGTAPTDSPQLLPAGPNAPGGGSPTAGAAEQGGEQGPPQLFAAVGNDYVYVPEAGGWHPRQYAAQRFGAEYAADVLPGFRPKDERVIPMERHPGSFIHQMAHPTASGGHVAMTITHYNDQSNVDFTHYPPGNPLGHTDVLNGGNYNPFEVYSVARSMLDRHLAKYNPNTLRFDADERRLAPYSRLAASLEQSHGYKAHVQATHDDSGEKEYRFTLTKPQQRVQMAAHEPQASFHFPGVQHGPDSLSGLLTPKGQFLPMAHHTGHEGILRAHVGDDPNGPNGVADAVLKHGFVRMEQLSPTGLDVELHHSRLEPTRRWIRRNAPVRLRHTRFTVYGDNNNVVNELMDHYEVPEHFLAGDPGERKEHLMPEPARDGNRTINYAGKGEDVMNSVAGKKSKKPRPVLTSKMLHEPVTQTTTAPRTVSTSTADEPTAQTLDDYNTPEHWWKPEELGQVRPKDVERAKTLYHQIPSIEEHAAFAKAGRTQRYWYKRAALLHHHLFPNENDAKTFSSLSAAMSNAVSPTQQTRKALETWKRWEERGRPGAGGWGDAESEEKVMRMLHGQPGLMFSNLRNAAKALLHHHTPTEHLSQQTDIKVPNYARNLWGDPRQGTFDTWHMRFLNLPDKSVNDPAAQLASLAKARATADYLNTHLGEKVLPWDVDQVQAGIWNVVKHMGDTWQHGKGNREPSFSTFSKLRHQDIHDMGDILTAAQKDPEAKRLIKQLHLGDSLKHVSDVATRLPAPKQSLLKLPVSHGINFDFRRAVSRLKRRILSAEPAKSGVESGPLMFSRTEAPNVGGEGHWLGFSPNVDSIGPEEAIRRYRSVNQAAFHRIADDNARKVGLQVRTYDVIGSWDDPKFGVAAENGVMQVIPGRHDPKQVERLAAWQGLTGNQHAVAMFHPDDNGPDSTYQINVPEPDSKKVMAQLSAHGIMSRAIIPYRGGHSVVFADRGRRLRSNAAAFARQYNAPINETVGTYSELGGGGSGREDSRRAYRSVIEAAERGQSSDG